jgi:hypothetical protein
MPKYGFWVKNSNKLPRAIQLGQQDRKWVRKPRVSWKNVESLKTEASKAKQASKLQQQF